MDVHSPTALDILVSSLPGRPDPALAIAGSRAGAIGILNLEFAVDPAEALDAIDRLSVLGRGRLGVLLDVDSPLFPLILSQAPTSIKYICLTAMSPDAVAVGVDGVHATGRSALVVATREEIGRAAADAGADAVIAKGHEAGGWVGEESTFVLIQRLVARLDVPVWAWGGVGRHTAAACAVAGAAGVVLDSQLLLTRESRLPEATRARIRTMDGSETINLGGEIGSQLRVYARPGLTPVATLRDAMRRIALAGHDGPAADAEWRKAANGVIGWDDEEGQVLAIGQDASFAADLADRFVTIGGVVEAIRQGAAENMHAAQDLDILAEGSPLAVSHGVRYPIAQGPMTRVSDRAEFADAVATAGALPFLALALMRAAEVDALLDETTRLLGPRPWGVGVLGFVPAELRAEQLEVIRRYRPPFALIAGGRPDQARSLEADGIATYLHVPSPGLLSLYLQDGARRFVFEGRECGGHVGPRTSFVLWDTMVRTLLSELDRVSDPTTIHVLFAGGVHDGVSAGMVAAIAAPLAARGVRVGVLVGTAYLFTEEAVAAGAIIPGFQSAAIACDATMLLESGPGHATRCLRSPFADDFTREKLDLLRSAASSEEVRNRLEELNIGRLRVASKGVDRHPDYGRDPDVPRLRQIDPSEQWARGMYMIGQIAALRDQVIPMSALHEGISAGSSLTLAKMPAFDGREHVTQPPARIAIVGIGSIFPGAPDVDTFWANIVDKVDAVTEVPASRWDWRLYFDPDRSKPDKIYSKWGGFIDDVAFDPVEFGMPPRSLQSIEPFQLLGLLVVKAALADAGYASRPFDRQRTSVVLGAGGGGADLTAGYMVRSTLPLLLGESAGDVNRGADGLLPEWTEDSFPGILMNVASGRIANRFDFGGANFTVDAACASSLAAVYLAIRDLQTGNSDTAIVGGVDAIQNPFAYLCFSKTQALSPTGRCRPFDADADGIAISEGFAALVLKRLDDAERDGDRIYAVIQGIGAASDGRDRSMTAPRPEGQMLALDRAYAHAGYSPASVGLFEAHGTGTVAGDQAEVQSLTTVLGRADAAPQSSALGSVKSMIGHTKATAGVAGLIKATLALHHRVLPPTLGVNRPNPKAGFPDSPLYVNTESRPWVEDSSHPRRAGVSAFGFGGTDFHIALEEYLGDFLDGQPSIVGRLPAELFAWRRASRAELMASIDGTLAQLDAGATPALADLAYSVNLAMPAGGGPTLAIVAESLADLAAKLRTSRDVLLAQASRQHLPTGVHFADEGFAPAGRVAFGFPGQGSQYANMGREVAVAFPDVRQTFDRADRLLDGRLDQPLSRYIFPPPGFSREDEKAQRAAITETNVAQPAIGATNLAFCSLLRSFGVEADMTAGHSYGEFIALAAAGALTEADALRLSEARGRFMREGATGESGTMAAVDAPPEALEPLLTDPDITLANLNSPKQTVISGGEASIMRAIEWCDLHGLRARRLPVACAFHSPYVAPAQGRLAEMLRETPVARPRVPVFSNTTAGAYPDDPAAIAELLSDHLTNPVRWVAEVEAMYEAGARIFVEVGPRNVLTNLVGSILDGRPHLAVAVDQPGRPGVVQLLHCLAALIVEGVPVHLDRLYRGRALTGLDLHDLKSATDTRTYSSATWLVNGGGARPATAPPRGAGRQPPLSVVVSESDPMVSRQPDHADVPMAQTSASAGQARAGRPANGHVEYRKGLAPMTATASNGSSTSHTSEVSHRVDEPLPQPDVPAIYETQPAALAGPDRVSDVMVRHQQVMQQFLETQRSIMLAYLGAGRPAPEQRWIDATARPRERVVEVAPAVVTNGHRPAPAPSPAVAAPAAAPPAPIADSRPAPPEPPPSSPSPVTEIVAPAPPVDAHQPLSREQVTEQLLAVVSERTGYPPEMLALDADLEADLGIDSIKRVEIAGTMMQSLPIPTGATPDIEQITASRTLTQVVDALVRILEPATGSSDVSATEARLPFDREPAGGRIGRFIVQAHPIGPIHRAGHLAAGSTVIVIDDGNEIGARVAASLSSVGHPTVRLDSRTTPLINADVVHDVVAGLRAQHGRISALIHMSSLARDEPVPIDDPPRRQRELDRQLAALHLVARALRADLEASVATGGAALLAVTAQGGAFAFDGSSDRAFAGDGALAGYVKTVAQEWSGVRARAIDLDWCEPETAARRVVAELFSDDEAVEVGYREDERLGIYVVPAPVAGRGATEPLDGDAVVLITGGARGITAEAALLLAELYRPTLVLVGRTPQEPEGPATAGAREERELKHAIMERQRAAGVTATPATIEAEFRRLIAQREVEENLDRMRRAGSRVEYLSCDVRDAAAFRALIDGVYERYGRIDGVIHGAGIIEDKLVQDKQLASFERVVATKAHSAFTLAAAIQPESLRFLTFFSSVSGRFGNRGQADYAAASEVLNKLAQELDRRWPAHITSINWGPWLKTGMVSEGVQRQFAERGVELIPLAVGCQRLIEELRFGRKGEVEVVVGGTREPLGGPATREAITLPVGSDPTPVPPSSPLRGLPLLAAQTELTTIERGVEAARLFDSRHDLYLDDHRIDGAPVVPFAVALELMAEAAAATAPHLPVSAIRDVRLLNGISVPDPQMVRVVARQRDGAGASHAMVEVTIASMANPARVHYRAVVELGSVERSRSDVEVLSGLGPFTMDAADVYRSYLFHGPTFQHIVSIDGFGPSGAISTIAPSESISCLLGATAPWVVDPVVVDCALQMQLVWTRRYWDVTLLPNALGSIRLFEPFASVPGTAPAIRHELRVRHESAAPICHADHAFYSDGGTLLATMSDMIGTGSRALNRVVGATQ